jgi:Fur family zinc uptake transcriptional regulator
MSESVGSTNHLTRNQLLVMGELSKVDGPLSAYEILDQLRDHGVRSPPQVYRALDKLVEFGLVHKLESLNAFVACRHPDGEPHEKTAFMICENCGQVFEITDDSLTKRVAALARDTQFSLTKSTIELRGICRGCQAA